MKTRSAFAILVTVSLLGLNLAVAPSFAAKQKTNSGKVCTIIGTSKADKISGTAKADVICGLGGNDVIVAKGGNDIVDGGTGNDTITAGDGDDQIYGGSGMDSISGGKGNDSLDSESGNDTILGESGSDKLVGGLGDDKLQGGAGVDSYDGGAGQNTCEIEQTELKPFTCQLLEKLNYLFSRVSGSVIANSSKFANCGIALYEYIPSSLPGQLVAGAQLDKDGNFLFDAPKGTFYYKIGIVDSIFNLKAPMQCQTVNGALTSEQHQITGVVSLTETVSTFNLRLEDLVEVTIQVVNKDGVPISGANLEIQSQNPAPTYSNIGTASVQALAHGQFAAKNGMPILTNDKGIITSYVYPGQVITMRAKVSIFGVVFMTEWQTIDTTSKRKFEFVFTG